MSVVGILVDHRVFRNLTSGKTGHEQVRLYNKAAARIGLSVIYLCLERTHPADGTAYGYRYAGGRYHYEKVRIPRVIHNRTMPTTATNRARMKRLRKTRFVFNARNRYSKYSIHRMLAGRFGANLPVTTSYSKPGLRRMMSRFDSLYIKPQSSSIGRGVIKASRKPGGRWYVQLPSKSFTAGRGAAEHSIDRVARRKHYLIQKAIPLAAYNGKPYDIRVSVQRSTGGGWQVTGMVGKVARRGSHVTNVARGGSVKRCDQLFRGSSLNAASASHSIKSMSLGMVRYLSKRLDRLADVGLDVGITSAGKPYLIELNCRDQRYSFKKANMNDTFYNTYANPLRYAKHVLSRK